MATKALVITDTDSGEILEKITFDGGYNIQWTDKTDDGTIKRLMKLDNGRFGSKHWIKNNWYRPIVWRLRDKFEEFKHLKPDKILFIEDRDWEEPKSDKQKRQWIARIRVPNKEFIAVTGYEYILETRNFYIERLQSEQIVAILYHELRHIGKDGDLVQHDIEDWGNMVASLGADWATTQGMIKDILEEDFSWEDLPSIAEQLNLFKHLKAVK